MKKLITLLLALAMVFSLCACSGGSDAPTTAEPQTDNSTPETEEPQTTSLDIELCAEYAISKLQSVLKNPNSLIINALYGVETGESYIFAIDYSAENGFGGMNRDNLFLEVAKIDNGFSVTTYGSGPFTDDDNQKYTAQFCAEYQNKNGYFVFDTQTIRVSYMIEGEGEVAPESVEFVGKLKSKNDSYQGAWNVQIGDNPYLKLVYFAEGTDFSWYEKCTGLPYEVTISAVLEDGDYNNAVIVNDPILDATDDERFQRFGYYDRKIIKENQQNLTPMSEEDIRAVLTGNTFKMRNNYGGDGDGTHTITFFENGDVDAHYDYKGTQYSMYQSWRIENGNVIMNNSFTSTSGEAKTVDTLFSAYQYDATRYLLIDESGDYSMVLTAE